MTKYPSFTETLGVSKTHLTLKSFLETPCPSKIARTRVWGTTTAKVNDSTSYLRALKAKRKIAENKRQTKAYFKQLREQIERQRYIQKRDFLEYQQPAKHHFSQVDENPSQNYSKPKEVNSENKMTLSKPSYEPKVQSKSQKEELSRNLIESEIKSTTVSCQEKILSKDIGVRTYPESHYNEYQIDSDNSPQIHQEPSHIDVPDLPNNRSLLDDLYEQNNQLDDFLESIDY